MWLSPVQARIVPIGERQMQYAEEVYKKIREAGIRVELDESGDGLGKKIRNSKLEKIPYTLVIGDKEVEGKTVTVESRTGNEGALDVTAFIERVQKEIKERSL